VEKLYAFFFLKIKGFSYWKKIKKNVWAKVSKFFLPTDNPVYIVMATDNLGYIDFLNG
jgi:hypothetical protein